jgi:hypothetical protein
MPAIHAGMTVMRKFVMSKVSNCQSKSLEILLLIRDLLENVFVGKKQAFKSGGILNG